MTENDAMQLDDLKKAWAQLDRRVDADLARMEVVTDALARDHTESMVRRAAWLPAMELVVEAVLFFAGVSGLFLRGGPVYFACLIGALVLLAALMVSSTWQVVAIVRVDPAAPVVATQRRLGRVRALRIFETKWILLLSPVLWAPFSVAGIELLIKLLSGDRASDIFSPGYVSANLLIGLFLTAVLWWASRRLAVRLRNTSFLRRLLDDMAGRRLTAACSFLTRLDKFERE